MGQGGTTERRRVRLTPPPEVFAEAKAHPGGSVAQIDTDYIGNPDGFIPAEAIQGVWIVGPDGVPTGEFEENPHFGPPKDEFAKFTDSRHWWDWLGDDPVTAVRDSIEGCLSGQAEGVNLAWVKILDAPRVLTGGRRQPGDDQHIIVTRAAVALRFALCVTATGREQEIVTGVFSWVAAGLDRPGERKDRVWLDVNAELDWAEQELSNRIYFLDAPGAGPKGAQA